MEIEIINLNKVDFKFIKVKAYFDNCFGILNVSKQIDNENKIDYEYLKLKMPSKIKDRPNIYGLYVKKRK